MTGKKKARTAGAAETGKRSVVDLGDNSNREEISRNLETKVPNYLALVGVNRFSTKETAMATEHLDIGPGTLFNSHMFDLGNRINTVCNYLLLVNGGILSITIGAFVGATPPRLAVDALAAIRLGWYSLTASMILALTATFLVLAGQMVVQMKMRKAYSAAAPSGLQLFTGPPWVGIAIRATLPLAFLTCVVGIASISYGAVQLLRIP